MDGKTSLFLEHNTATKQFKVTKTSPTSKKRHITVGLWCRLQLTFQILLILEKANNGIFKSKNLYLKWKSCDTKIMITLTHACYYLSHDLMKQNNRQILYMVLFSRYLTIFSTHVSFGSTQMRRARCVIKLKDKKYKIQLFFFSQKRTGNKRASLLTWVKPSQNGSF